MPESTCEIRPTDDAELRAALADASRGPGQARPVSAFLGGLIFQFSDQTLRGCGAELSGPYCESCRKAIQVLSYTEWTTAHRNEAEEFRDCPHCGLSFTFERGLTLAALRTRALAALDARVFAAGIDRQGREIR